MVYKELKLIFKKSKTTTKTTTETWAKVFPRVLRDHSQKCQPSNLFKNAKFS